MKLVTKPRELFLCAKAALVCLAGSNAFAPGVVAGILQAHNVRAELHGIDGGHTWVNCRHYLSDYAQLLFR